MDGLIKRWDAVKDGDLMICRERGVAYQRDMSKAVAAGMNAAGENYFDHYQGFAADHVASNLHHGRTAFVDASVGGDCAVLDIGIGCGQFIARRPNTWGFDVNPKAIEWLKSRDQYADNLTKFNAFTLWDVLEHVEEPIRYFRHMPDGCHLFACLPIFGDLSLVRNSKHYKPNEHLYYWTEQGFVDWMSFYRFRLLGKSAYETEAGRESILSFAFVRDLPGYHATVDQYRQLYSPNYGATAYLYFDTIAREVLKLRPKSILDFGCGRSDLVAHFWNDGNRRIAKYDPAINQFEMMPEGKFDLVLCTDVMEHILMSDVQHIFDSIKGKSTRALFTISLRPARKKLPDGRNAHVTLLTENEWMQWINSAFGRAKKIAHATEDHILMAKTF